MRIYLIRHAETASNALGFYPPAKEDPSAHLLAYSVQQLQLNTAELGEELGKDATIEIYSSEAVRAKLTAQIIGEDLAWLSYPREDTVTISHGHRELNERSFGPYDGRPKEEFVESDEQRKHASLDLGRTLELFLQEKVATSNSDVLILVTHGGPIRGYQSLNTVDLAPTPPHSTFIEVILEEDALPYYGMSEDPTALEEETSEVQEGEEEPK